MNLPSLLIALLWVMFGVWLLAGLGDWLCHRRSQIQRSAGTAESALHLLLYLLIAAPIVVALFMEINATVLVFMATCVLAHMAVSLWDTSFAQPRRHISPLEQQIHSYLEMLPLFAVTLAVVLHWEAFVEPEWGWSLRLRPLPPGYRAGVLLALLVGLLLIVEELLRCLRAAAQPRSPE
jgi:hypothetical protein